MANRSSTPLVRFDCVSKRFGHFLAVDRLSLDIAAGEFFALLGPSGCGKTTLLRLLAGFETPSEGNIYLDGEEITAVPPYRRPVNMMFQSYALFPHLTVFNNVAFGLRQERLPRQEIAARVMEILALVKLEALVDRKPHQLSGGQRQRVALARSLAKRPKVLLLDEPLAALDRKLREETQFELAALQKKLGTSFVIVTHDQDEAMALADRIAVMDHGHIAQIGTPAEIYEQPASRYVADFVGAVNLIEGRLVTSGPAGCVIEIAGGVQLNLAQQVHASRGAAVWVALRPEKLALSTEPPEFGLTGTVRDVGYFGNLSIYKIALDNGLVLKVSVANTTRRLPQRIGQGQVWVTFSPDAATVLVT
jgi:putrescine transport system ATP-binding protein